MRTVGILVGFTILDLLVVHALAQNPSAESGFNHGTHQIVLNPGRPHDAFLLDTTTGTVWIQRTIGEAKGQAEVLG
jgi:hypothetical protein